MEVQPTKLGQGIEQPIVSPANNEQATRTSSVKKAPAQRTEQEEDDTAAQRTEQIEDDTATQGTDRQDPWR